MKRLLEITEWPLAVLAVGLFIAAGQSEFAQAQEVNVEAGGTTIQVGPDKGAGEGTSVKVDVNQPGENEIVIQGQPDAPAPVEKRYLIGIVGGEVSPELRAHLGLQKNGVIVRGVSKNSPAEKAGIQQHDIVIQAGGAPVTDMSELADLVKQVGPTGGSIELVVIRGGKQETIVVKPEERAVPQVLAQPNQPAPGAGIGGRNGGGLGGLDGMLDGLLGGRGEGQPFQFRMFGPGLMIDGQNVQLNGMNGTSVSVQRQNGQTRVKVTQGDKTWDIDGNDPAAINSLPPEVRGMVEGMLNGEGAGGGINIDLNDLMPDLEGMNIFGRGGIAPQDEINRRMIEMEQQMQELRRRIMGEPPAAQFPPGAEDEAPAFVPDAEVEQGPVEVEIPAEDK